MSGIDWSKAPEGATHYWPGNSRFYEKVGGVYFVAGEQRYGSVHAADSWVKKLIPRPSPAWSGEGLPPVGTVCEVYHCDEWAAGEVIAHFQQKAGMVAAYTVEVGDGIKHLDCAIAECFRPIRTPEQIAADEREAAIEELRKLLSNVSCDDYHAAVAMIDAGYRKQADK